MFIRPAIAATALLIAVALAGCSSAPEAQTLAQTKSPTQLLRNEASTRIPPGSIGAISGEEDHSVACKSSDEDPDELYRSWQSSLLASIAADSAWRVEQLTTDITDSFIEDGWYVSGAKDGKDKTVLTRPGAVSTMAFTVTAGAEDGSGASIHIDATGPCVLTAGPTSNEVTGLEKKKS